MVGTIGKQTHPEYLGVVRQWGGFRLVVVSFGQIFNYRLQALLPFSWASAPQWVPISGSSVPSLKRLLDKFAASTVGLSDVAQGLPDDPALAAPALVSALAAEDDFLKSL